MPQLPLHSFEFEQFREQLSPQVAVVMSQDEPEGQLQVAPLHVGGVAVLPQANPTIERTRPTLTAFMFLLFLEEDDVPAASIGRTVA